MPNLEKELGCAHCVTPMPSPPNHIDDHNRASIDARTAVLPIWARPELDPGESLDWMLAETVATFILAALNGGYACD